MEQNLISIDDDSLDMVSGGGLFGAIGHAADHVVGSAVHVVGEVVEGGAYVAGGLLGGLGGLLSGIGGFLQGKKRW